MEFYDVIRARRSIRAYEQKAVAPEALDRILEAARLAPSAANRQPWLFYVVTDAAAKEKLKAAYGNDWFWTAPVVIVACGRPGEAWVRKDGKSYLDVDVSIAFEHIVLAAAAEGLGTCWIGAFDAKAAREVLDIPSDLEPIAMTPLGLPAETGKAQKRKKLNEIIRRI